MSAVVEEELPNMNFDDAIFAHSSWKMKLAKYLARPDHSLKVAEVASDKECALGKWLHSEGLKYSHLPEFKKLVSEHAQFHKEAANVVARADAGQNVTEEVALCANSAFGHASSSVVRTLQKVKSMVVKGEHELAHK